MQITYIKCMILAMTVYRVPFFGRDRLLATLSAHLDSVAQEGTGRILAIRGRRQVGKSTVVERFVASSGVPSVFVTAVFGASSVQHLADATAAITESLHPLPNTGLLTQSTASSWREWLGRIGLAAQSGPVVVVLDEFPWFTTADPALEGELQVQWDRTLEKLPVLLILIGSDVTMMDRLATHGRPLFGRLRPLVVPALNPAELAEAIPGATAAEVLDGYLITGGYPRLVADLARSSGSPTEYVRVSLADPFSPLVTTARLSLDAEFHDGPIAYQVLSAIGSDDTARPGFTNILTTIADPADRKRAETGVTRALRTLVDDKGLIERERPAWAAAPSRLRRYRISDPYLRFWFRYLEKQTDLIARGRSDLAIGAFDRDWSSWRGRSIEPVVRQSLLRLATTDARLGGVESVRPWWLRDNRVEVDVVAATRSRTLMVGTVKWRTDGVTERDLSQLRADRALVPHATDAFLAAISPTGKAPKGADIVYSAADLLAAWKSA